MKIDADVPDECVLLPKKTLLLVLLCWHGSVDVQEIKELLWPDDKPLSLKSTKRNANHDLRALEGTACADWYFEYEEPEAIECGARIYEGPKRQRLVLVRGAKIGT